VLRATILSAIAFLVGASLAPAAPPAIATMAPGSRVMGDAHNCYPYNGKWSNRLDRALALGGPVAIEQDLATYTNRLTGEIVVVVSHDPKGRPSDPTLRDYFFERIRPQMEAALRAGNQGDWPLITLNLDLKSERPAELAAIWKVLAEYQDWMTTAPRTANLETAQPLDIKPLLVLTGSSNRQRVRFYDDVPIGGRLLAFGAVPAGNLFAVADNYHRWSNHNWSALEARWPFWAAQWSTPKQKRLDAMVASEHARGLWTRVYCLDGESGVERRRNGWSWDANFGSVPAVQKRWQAAISAGVDFIATDQYEGLAALLAHDH
jgi:hypothetical protein